MQMRWEILQTLDPKRPRFIQLLQLQIAAPSQSVMGGGFKSSWEADRKTVQNQYKYVHLLCRDTIKAFSTFN